MLVLVHHRCERLDSVAIPEYFAPPEVFSLASESSVIQWKPVREFGSAAPIVRQSHCSLKNWTSSPTSTKPGCWDAVSPSGSRGRCKREGVGGRRRRGVYTAVDVERHKRHVE